MSQLTDFNAAAQSGQEMSRENLWPASITLPGVVGEIACSGGSVRETGVHLMVGGMMGEFLLAFRVRKELLTGPPEVNTRLGYLGKQWLIMRVINDPRESAYIIGADNLSK